MNKITRFITPLSIVFISSLSYAIYCFNVANEEGWGQYVALFVFIFFSIPSLAANAIINRYSGGKTKLILQLIVSTVFIVVFVFLLGFIPA